MSDRATTVMFVHGAWHGSWCWDAVRERLEAGGVPTAAVDNPSVTTAGADLAADGDNLRAALDAVGGPILLVGHSYGGAVVSDAGAHPNVEHLAYLSAFPLDAGESVMQNAIEGGDDLELAKAISIDGDTVSVDPARQVELFYHDCAPECALAAAARLVPMSLAAMAGTARAAAWREKPSTYIVCTDDRALPVALQQSAAARTGAVIDMPTSHSPFLSRPDELAAILTALVTKR
jgi:pimeloyl-ACP methyl ester carboxylesterase